MSDYWWGRPVGEPVPHISMPRRLFVDRGVLRIPAGTSDHEALHAVLDSLAEGQKFMVQDERTPTPKKDTP
jgi:hypothetical protein